MSLVMTESWEVGNGSGFTTWAQGKWSMDTNLYPATNAGRHGCALRNQSGAGGHRLYTHYVRPSQEHATFIYGSAHYWSTGASGQYRPLVRFLSDTGATLHIVVWYDWTNQRVTVGRGDPILSTGTTLGSSVNGSVPPDVWHYMEVKAVLDDTAGSVEVRKNGVAILTFTGIDTKNGGTKTVFDSIQVGSNDSGQDNFRIDDTYLCNGAGTKNNDFLGDVIIEFTRPDGNGTTSGQMGSDGNQVNNYQLVNEYGDSTYVDGITTGDKDTYSVSNSAYAAPSTILAVTVNARSWKTDTGPRSNAMVALYSGTEVVGEDVPLTLGASVARGVFEDRPGGTGWTMAEFNATEFGQVARP